MYKITIGQKKLLTEKLLGECWHDLDETYVGDGVHPMSYTIYFCHKCGLSQNRKPIDNRTFTTISDRQAVFEKLWEKLKWNDFVYYALGKFYSQTINGPILFYRDANPYFIRWLCIDNSERACCLVAEFMEEK